MGRIYLFGRSARIYMGSVIDLCVPFRTLDAFCIISLRTQFVGPFGGGRVAPVSCALLLNLVILSIQDDD